MWSARGTNYTAFRTENRLADSKENQFANFFCKENRNALTSINSNRIFIPELEKWPPNMNDDSNDSSVSDTLAGCISMTAIMAVLGFVGLWVGYSVGSYLGPEDELLMGYIATNEEVYGALFGGVVGLLLAFAAFHYGKKLLEL